MDAGHTFGPVPSRRLGRSLGINNIPPKICTYSCVYCQLGRSLRMTAQRQEFYQPGDLLAEAELKIRQALEQGETIDYLSLVPDGEPALDRNLGRLIRLLKQTGYRTAVITNSSLLALPEVREELGEADWVSVKVDAVREDLWRRIDRPHKEIRFDAMLDGIRAFAASFAGVLATETMLVKGVNDAPGAVAELAGFLRRIDPAMAYLSVPVRPPAEPWVEPPGEEAVMTAYQQLREHGVPTECLIGYEGNAFACTGDLEEDILSITAVHPMREDAIQACLQKAQVPFSTVEAMVSAGKLVVADYRGARFYLRKLRRDRPRPPAGGD